MVAKVFGIFGVILYVLTGWLYLTSGLVVPFPWVYVLWAIWLAGLIVLRIVFRDRPLLTPLVAVGAVVAWVAYVQLGSWLFGWTA